MDPQVIATSRCTFPGCGRGTFAGTPGYCSIIHRDDHKATTILSIGFYRVVYDRLPVTASKSRQSKRVCLLSKDEIVEVIEFADKDEDGRLRARIFSPAGWISARNDDGSFEFVVSHANGQHTPGAGALVSPSSPQPSPAPVIGRGPENPARSRASRTCFCCMLIIAATALLAVSAVIVVIIWDAITSQSPSPRPSPAPKPPQSPDPKPPRSPKPHPGPPSPGTKPIPTLEIPELSPGAITTAREHFANTNLSDGANQASNAFRAMLPSPMESAKWFV